MIKKIAFAFSVVALLLSGAASGQNLNQPGGQLNNLNVPSGFQGGTWTPVLSGLATTTATTPTNNTPGTFTYQYQTGSYEIIGRQVTARFNLATLSTVVSPGGIIGITGLPVAATLAGTPTPDYGTCQIETYNGMSFDSGYSGLAGIITPGTTIIGLIESGSGKSIAMLGALSGGVVGVTSTPTQIIGVCNYHSP